MIDFVWDSYERYDEKRMNYTYIVKCKDGTYYTGWTNNLEKRIADHNAGRGAKYTKTRFPVTLVYYEEFGSKQEAMKREYAIKQMKREEKRKLIDSWEHSQSDICLCPDPSYPSR